LFLEITTLSINILFPDKYKSFQRFVEEPKLHVLDIIGKMSPSILISPIISNLAEGFWVPIPTFPLFKIVKTSELLLEALNMPYDVFNCFTDSAAPVPLFSTSNFSVV
jgi:hypothetical protein